jgi:prolipoprotein diacylglyceryltransferase
MFVATLTNDNQINPVHPLILYGALVLWNTVLFIFNILVNKSQYEEKYSYFLSELYALLYVICAET